MRPKSFPGGALNYVSGPCRFFVPYKVGHLLSPETHFKRTWSKFAHFHVTWPPIPQPRPHRRRFCVADGAPGRRLVGSGRPGRAPPKPHQLVSFGCVEKWAPVNWRDLGVSKNGPCELVRFGCVEKWSLRTGQIWVCRKRRPAPPGPAGLRPRPQRQLASWECVENARPAPPKARPANWRAPNTPKPAWAPAPTPKSAVVDWRVPPTARPGPREARPSHRPPPSARRCRGP
jgi:hypothetical protein